MIKKVQLYYMKILVIAATAHEIKPPIPINAEILITGIGTATTIYKLQKKIQDQTYDLIIQAGIAGTFSSEFKLGETVIVKQDCFGDLGTEEKGIFTSIFDTGLEDKDAYPYENGWLINKHPLLNNTWYPITSAVTINKVSDSDLQQQQLVNTFTPQIETMEGAAFHYVCLQEKIPFLQLRSISNRVGERDKTKWKITEAIKNLNESLHRIVKEIIN